jgi:hypothetical protein
MSTREARDGRVPRRFTAWQDAYDEILRATDKSELFKLVEVAESAILVRRDLLSRSSNHAGERRAIEEALRVVFVIKQQILKFTPYEPEKPHLNASPH